MSSLVEVARVAGVAVSTASRVLSGSDHPISAKTRARVLAAAEELEYSPSALARAMVSPHSRLVGVLVSDIDNPYFSVIARGVDDVATRAGHVTMLSNVDRRTTTEISRLQAMRDYRAAGVIFAGSGHVDDPETPRLAKAVRRAREQGIRTVSLAVRDLGGPSFVVDNRAVAYDITDHLVSLGHRRVAFIEGPPGMTVSLHRREGFLSRMAEAGLAEEALCVPGGFDYQAGHAATLRLLARPPLPDAILAANDEVAVGALSALRQAGIAVPKEISVAGMDDLRTAEFVGLTTVSLPLYEMGSLAARHIIDGADGAATTVLSHRVVPRETTARRPPAACSPGAA
ncbi:LacI family transcriptional regulator [Streptomyces sp. WAC 01529]|uniref:LacI family DNA-binding transcriptional regulator n=1 Tax=Streptomyces sp. WAC 01529 TaxID=2203205 RepID=UPI000F6ECFE9|nr:LacI family DNA-binding transcriptional regulator [Streptomyces sp. WAC 01529]AZM56449.1 LacI family transcriptional regulator [Streptomyces sp. WAC 01529]